MPYAAPATGAEQAPMVAPGAAGTAYRLPGTGQLVISRPSTLLFPPPVFPSSHLANSAVAGRTARTATAPDAGKAQSRLLVPKPAEPMVPQVTQPAPSVATAVPRQPVTQAPVAKEPMAEKPADSAVTAAIPPEIKSEPAPAAEPSPPPAATVTPKTEPIAPATPPAVAALPPEPAPAAEAPSAPALLQPVPPSPKDEPAATEITPKPEPEPKKPEAKPEPKPSQSAALTPATGSIGEMRLVFSAGSAELTTAAAGQLNSMAKELLANAEARVQLLAYAQASEEGTSRARRLSLSRALAVRAFLIEKGVRSTRMDVRALGSGFQDGPPDRVDILPQESTQ
jgi:outer membrane protein OmpA-like peptidoglycan-associated protein